MHRWLNKLLNDAEWRLSLWNMVFGPGGIMTSATVAALVATYFTEPLKEFSPLSYVVVALLVWVFGTVAYYLYSSAKARIQILEFRSRVAERNLINPLDAVFTSVRIHVSSLSPPLGTVISDKTFLNCDIIGPANVMFFPDCTFHSNGGEVVDGVVIKDGFRPTNGFLFRGCAFRNCRFYLMTFMVPEQDYNLFERHGWHGLNWISDTPPQDKQENLKLDSPKGTAADSD